MKNKYSKTIPDPSDKKLNSRSIYFALLSGIFLFLSFPKFGLGFIAWISFVPLFIALRDVSSLRRALFLGWITGLSACTGILYWIAYVIVNYGNLPLYLGVMIMLLLACYLSIYFALFAAGIVYLRKKVPLYLVAPVLWVCLEYAKSKLFTGFPWENLGYSQFSNIFFIQSADIAGVFGISFLIILLNVAFFEIIAQRTKKSFVLATIVLFIWSGVYGYGILRINQINKALKEVPEMDVSLIQGNIDQSIKWNTNFQKETINIYEELSLRRPAANGGLMVWP
ncbi:MAG: apolipoprotein N-acyltransferase, partial [Deltaproteobacteria bacterium HGW-Deltaproteobacteria-7]